MQTPPVAVEPAAVQPEPVETLPAEIGSLVETVVPLSEMLELTMELAPFALGIVFDVSEVEVVLPEPPLATPPDASQFVEEFGSTQYKRQVPAAMGAVAAAAVSPTWIVHVVGVIVSAWVD
jgi:hypothetical protein